jgi:hypothetical protein
VARRRQGDPRAGAARPRPVRYCAGTRCSRPFSAPCTWCDRRGTPLRTREPGTRGAGRHRHAPACCGSTPPRLVEPDRWVRALAHGLLHLGFGHGGTDRHGPAATTWPAGEAAVACLAVESFLDALKLGTAPGGRIAPPPLTEARALVEQWQRAGVPASYGALGSNGPLPDLVIDAEWLQRQLQPADRGAARAAALARPHLLDRPLRFGRDRGCHGRRRRRGGERESLGSGGHRGTRGSGRCAGSPGTTRCSAPSPRA